MIDALRFVKGAVADKDFIPELTYFRIYNGHITAYNGRTALSSPIDIGFNVLPRASTFIKALDQCVDKISMHMTPKGRLCITSGGFRVFVECLEDITYELYPRGDSFELTPDFISGLRAVAPFMGEDASRPWASAVHCENGSLYATNNIIAIERWTGVHTPSITLPADAVKQLLRLKASPHLLQTDQSSCTFHFADNRWMRLQLVEDKWPISTFETILDAPDMLTPVDANLFIGLNKLKPFIGEKTAGVYLLGDRISTHDEEGYGAEYFMNGLPSRARFNIHQLLLLEGIATEINLARGNLPGIFRGKLLRGAITSMVL